MMPELTPSAAPAAPAIPQIDNADALAMGLAALIVRPGSQDQSGEFIPVHGGSIPP
jgi:hypothetical protein